MVSRVALVAALVLAGGIASAGARTPPTGTAMLVVHQDMRLCPSPRCGGYWVALANGVRTRCVDGVRHPRCYAAHAVDRNGRAVGRLADGALVRGALEIGRDGLGKIVARALYAPAGSASAGGGYYRVVDNGTRCVRDPCFSFTARSVNASTRVTVSTVDLEAAGASASARQRAQAALATKDGLYARGRFTRTPDGGTVFRALRLFLRAPLPRA